MEKDFYTTYNIDIKQLSRDFLVHPLQRIKRPKGGFKLEHPTIEDMKYLYIDKELPKNVLLNYFNIGGTTLTTILHEYGIKRDVAIKNRLRETTNLKKYGVSHNSQIKSIQKDIQENNLRTFGKKHYFQTQEFKDKRSQTLSEKYHISHNSQIPEVKEHVRETNLKKYGNEIFSRSNTFRQSLNKNIHLVDKTVWEILDNKTLLYEYITKNNIKTCQELSDKLSIGNSCLNKRITEYDLRNLFDYSQSNSEREVREFINQFFKTENNIKVLDGKEIDIYIPEKKLGIEFNGNYWHSEIFKSKTYHYDKSVIANSEGIFLYHIFEYEWNTRKEQIKNQLRNLLGVNNSRIFARKCTIKEVSNSDKKDFLLSNHLQGDDVCSIRLGLYYEEELVSVMTFVKPRFNHSYQWELSRFASKGGCNVIGGASRLFKHFIKVYKPKSIISYSNMAHTKGNLYATLGFTLNDTSSPNYVWINNKDVLTRYQCQKHKLIEQGFQGTSEVDIMHSRGYYRVYDCGNKVWIYKKD